MLSRIVLVTGAIVAACGLLVGCGASSSSDGRDTVVAAFYPLAYAAEQIAGPTVDDPQPDARGRRASRSRADARRRARRRQGAARPLSGRRVHAGARDGSEGTARALARPSLRATTGNEAAIRTCGSTRCATRRWSARSVPHSATGRPRERLAGRLERLDAEYRAGLARCRRRADRDEPRRLRLSRGPLRPRAGAARGALAGGRAVGARPSPTSSPS